MDTAQSPVLQVEDICIYRGKTKILTGINWTVQPGEHWVIVGANGSGKTTLLSTLTGLFPPSSGTVSVLGEMFGDYEWQKIRQRIGLVSSSIRQMMPDDERGIESIVGGKDATLDYRDDISPADERKARKILKQIECLPLMWREWRVLSQGERQRILIGRTLMAQPEILILDEPCSGLDPAAREHFLAFVERLGSQPDAPAIVLVTHHVEEIMPCFSKVLVLKNGKTLASGTKSEIMKSAILTEAFGTKMNLRRTGQRYQLKVETSDDGIIV